MAYATTTHGNECQAFLSVKRNRLKQYDNKTVYLQDSEEFELELFNPTSYKFLAKIKLNGNYISSSGIVLKPGQRVFIERYLDDAKKFKFETYTVSNSKESLDAIQKNGLVEVEFYQEFIPSNFTNNFTIYNTPTWYNGLGSVTTGGNNVLYSTSSSVGAYTLTNGNISTSTASLNVSSSNNTNNISQEFDAKMTKNFKETGRVEKGSDSNQEFKNDFGNYSSWVSNVVTWKILPKSEKPYESTDLKTYCTNCGHKIKKANWKFCPACGNKLS